MTKDIKDSNELLTNGKLREQLIGKVEVLDMVKGLLLLPSTNLATTQQVSEFYEVSTDVVNNLVFNHEIEFSLDGYSVFKKDEVLNLLNVDSLQLERMKGKVIATMDNGDQVIIPNRGLRLFPRRAILRIGMLLKDSKVAQEIRNQLLNIEEKTSVDIKVADIDEEKELAMELGMAIANGDLIALSEANAKMVAFKMNGEKGVLFTATYVERFYEMENQLKQELQSKLPTTYKEALLALVLSTSKYFSA